MKELVFEVTQEEDGGYCAECLTENIFTQGETWEELRQNVRRLSALISLTAPKPNAVSGCTLSVTKSSRPYEDTPAAWLAGIGGLPL